MKVTGYKLREALRAYELRLKTITGRFADSLKAFEGEKKDRPTSLDERIWQTEIAIVRLQAAQTQYNLAVTQVVDGTRYTLLELVKMVGGAGRREKRWRSIAAPTKDRYAYGRDDDTRDPAKTYAKTQVSAEEAEVIATKTAKFAGAVRDAINVGNGTSIEISDLDPKLFE